jgi:YD repeat-containing protein
MESSVYEPNLDTVDYTYDDADQLVEVNRNSDEVTYKYNGDELMTERAHTTGGVTTTTRYYYDGANIIAEAMVSGGTVTFKAAMCAGHSCCTAKIPRAKYTVLHNGHGDVTSLREC